MYFSSNRFPSTFWVIYNIRVQCSIITQPQTKKRERENATILNTHFSVSSSCLCCTEEETTPRVGCVGFSSSVGQKKKSTEGTFAVLKRIRILPWRSEEKLLLDLVVILRRFAGVSFSAWSNSENFGLCEIYMRVDPEAVVWWSMIGANANGIGILLKSSVPNWGNFFFEARKFEANKAELFQIFKPWWRSWWWWCGVKMDKSEREHNIRPRVAIFLSLRLY